MTGLEMRDGEIHARVSLGAPYAGAPQLVHGGVIAAVFDEVLGVLNVMNEQGGMTGMLTIKYRAPTPIDQVLRLVGRHERTVGTAVGCCARTARAATARTTRPRGRSRCATFRVLLAARRSRRLCR